LLAATSISTASGCVTEIADGSGGAVVDALGVAPGAAALGKWSAAMIATGRHRVSPM